MQGRGFQDAATPFAGASAFSPRAGARNLLAGCADVRAGQHVVIVAEDPALGWYDAEAPAVVAAEAEALGATVTIVPAGPPSEDLSNAARDRIDTADLTIFFARIGDKDRFGEGRLKCPSVVSYARTVAELGSSFATRPHAELQELKSKVEALTFQAQSIEVTCPLGTRLNGSPAAMDGVGDVTVKRFPLCVPAPVVAESFSGVVALTRYLTPTGSQSYDPPSAAINGTVMAKIENGRLTDLQGPPDAVTQIRAHHEHVGALFNIDPDVVHSWHAGIHSGCDAVRPAAPDPDLWSNSVFGSPRWLHFHTCGNYPPGEICWMVRDPTVLCDGRPVWQDGVLTA
ncbi:MAG: hypothetical protein AAGJ28_05195 [Pseudomonadota bacterium]